MLNDVENKMDLVPYEVMNEVDGVYFTAIDARNWCCTYTHSVFSIN